MRAIIRSISAPTPCKAIEGTAQDHVKPHQRGIHSHDREEDTHHKAQKAPLPRRQRGENGENGGESRLPVAKKREAGGETLISGVRRPL